MKRIITCSDGTWNTINPETNTNVVKMYNSICKEGLDENGNKVMQLKSYDEGVGTGYTFKDKVLGGTTGSGIDTNIKDMYVFIMVNYEPGDQIFLFGFSRGAYTARSIAGLIRNSGILKRKYLHLVDKAYDLYRDKNDYSSPDSDLMKSFRREYATEENTPIHFIGVWDTVGALGVPLPWYKLVNNKKYKFHDVKLGKHIKHAYHALAIDERRKLFEPTLWVKSASVMEDKDHKQQLEQRWFPGVHSNVGGGYRDCGLSNIPLQWLFDKAEAVGLCFNEPPLINVSEFDKGEIINSYTTFYWFWLPRRRKMRIKKDTNEIIDESAWNLFYNNSKYRPQGLSILHNFKNSDKPPVKIYTFKNLIHGLPTVLFFYLVIYTVFAFLCLWELYPGVTNKLLLIVLFIITARIFKDYFSRLNNVKERSVSSV